MLVRVAVVCACIGRGLLGAGLAAAEELGPEQARAFVVGKLFSYTCFEGTAGVGRIFPDGSVVGTIRIRGEGQTRFAALAGRHDQGRRTSMCAHLPGLPITPASRCRNSTTGASAARSPAWASPIATSTSATRAAN